MKTRQADEYPPKSNRGVLGHTQHPHSRPWIEIDKVVTSTLADIVG